MNKIEHFSYGRPDRGIDVVLLHLYTGEKIAIGLKPPIQVKRYNRPIELGLIHQFFGSMVDNDFKKGIFVTSSRFRKGCHSVRHSFTGP